MLEESGHDRELVEWLDAAESGDVASVVDRLKRGMDVNARDKRSRTALMEAVHHRHLDLVRVLLDHGADPGLEDSTKSSSITYALIKSRSWEVHFDVPDPEPAYLERLLAAGGQLGLREAVLLGDLGLVRVRLDEGADIDAGNHSDLGSALTIAALHGHLEIVRLLLDRGADIETTDDLGQRALKRAAGYGRVEVARLLLDRGAYIDAIDWIDEDALGEAAEKGYHDVVRLLLDRGARIRVATAFRLHDEDRLRALLDDWLRDGGEIDEFGCFGDDDWLRENGEVDENESDRYGGLPRLAIRAARRYDLSLLDLLLDLGATHLNEWLDRHSLLAEAARLGRVEAIRLLLERGADLHAVGKDGLTPLAWAIRSGQLAAAGLLRRAGAVR